MTGRNIDVTFEIPVFQYPKTDQPKRGVLWVSAIIGLPSLMPKDPRILKLLTY